MIFQESLPHSTPPRFTYRSPQTWLALVVFTCVWLLVAKKWSYFPIGRTAASLLGASLVVLGGVLTPQEAFQSVSGNTILLLVGLMVVLAKLEEKGLMTVFKRLLLWGGPSPISLLVRVSFLSAGLGAIVMNDGAAIFLSNVITTICEQGDLPVEPYALALATSANFGSAATIIGNPKNMIVHDAMPSIDFLAFLVKMGPVSLTATGINTLCIVGFYWRQLKDKRIKRLKVLTNDEMNGLTLDGEGDEEDWDDAEGSPTSTIFSDDATSRASWSGEEFNDESVSESDSDLEGAIREPLLKGGDKGKRPRHVSVNVDVHNGWIPAKNVEAAVDSFSLVDEGVPSPVHISKDDPIDAVSALTSNGLHHRKPWLEKPSDHPSTSGPAVQLPLPTLLPPPSYIFRHRTPLNLARLAQELPTTVPYPTTPAGLLRYHLHLTLRTVLHSPYLIKVMYALVILAMYAAFFSHRFNLGFTAVASAKTLLALDSILVRFKKAPPETRDIAVPSPSFRPLQTYDDPTATLSESVNWPLLCYLFGMFIILEAVRKTPFPNDVWNLFEPALLNRSYAESVFIFSIVTVFICLIFTSIPSVLLLAPHIRQLAAKDPRWGTVGWFLLSWNVTACGNLTPFGSVAGLIVSEVCRGKVGERWVGDVRVWMRFAAWATVICLLVGVGVVAGFA
ncbi:uncharacterized protein SPPG_00962 [Spizellomyces punctatus DAOM BR117]|uniref:Citrate transporter-like domain-containing protein n=1 Tax=Spizellomyces punctatus (strain DAOM BR117) TaxID=645134 RepID=A0A0L0HQY0_SPIPD|nr:uncharacterized protein SPPG_00962 [Spizellomyces punctatus DAOM BR117]KND03478.1 hypothetical protein SPPG_00962 [Spizellomyces punctatus DAOM BR117]|eukprot:XP_016611517.1 hypothetical protein SPPG_00962 [Spizellomyces punctatus DAOM BR117]